MRTNQDAYGQAMHAFHQGGKRHAIIEREGGYIDTDVELAVYSAPYRSWQRSEKRAMPYVNGRVLDIGCGAGRHSLYLQKKGFKVTGIDISPLCVKVCKLRGLKDARVRSIAEIGPGLGTFDTILMMGNNFGLFGSFQRARQLLKRFARLTNDQARIIAQSRDPYLTKNPEHLRYHAFNRRRGRMAGQIRIRARFLGYATPWFDYLFVSPDEMKKIVAGTGWRVRRFIRQKGELYVAIIEKE